MTTAEEVIQKLKLIPLPGEGGFYRETYRSDGPSIPAKTFGIPSTTSRYASTAIYYLVTPESFSTLHRVKSDEIFHFYAGDPVEMIQIDDGGSLSRHIIGNDVFNNEDPQVVVRKGIWQGTRLAKEGSWALLGTTVAPGFEFEDFELGDRKKMLDLFPQHRDDVIRFTREPNEKAD